MLKENLGKGNWMLKECSKSTEPLSKCIHATYVKTNYMSGLIVARQWMNHVNDWIEETKKRTCALEQHTKMKLVHVCTKILLMLTLLKSKHIQADALVGIAHE